jgi:hypothetical protein
LFAKGRTKLVAIFYARYVPNTLNDNFLSSWLCRFRPRPRLTTKTNTLNDNFLSNKELVAIPIFGPTKILKFTLLNIRYEKASKGVLRNVNAVPQDSQAQERIRGLQSDGSAFKTKMSTKLKMLNAY